MNDMNEPFNSMSDTKDVDEQDRTPWGARLRSVAREGLILAAVIAFTFAARSSFGDHYTVPSGSMEQTLQVGDRVLVDKTAYGVRIPFTELEVVQRHEPARGEVVILDSPTTGVRLIKRVVAVGKGALSQADHGDSVSRVHLHHALVEVPCLVDLVDLHQAVGLEDLFDHVIEPTPSTGCRPYLGRAGRARRGGNWRAPAGSGVY